MNLREEKEEIFLALLQSQNKNKKRKGYYFIEVFRNFPAVVFDHRIN